MVRIFNMNRHYFDRMQEKLDQLKNFSAPNQFEVMERVHLIWDREI